MTAIRKLNIGEAQGALPFFDMTTSVPRPNREQERLVEKKLAELRKLADDLNQALYACKASERPAIHSPGDAFQILHPFMVGLDHEELWVMNLNARNRMLSVNRLYSGSVNASQVRVGEVFKPAIRESASALLIAHNHPSGDPSPSPDDIAITRAITMAGKLLDIDVLDHLVIGADRFVSMKERGLGFGG